MRNHSVGPTKEINPSDYLTETANDSLLEVQLDSLFVVMGPTDASVTLTGQQVNQPMYRCAAL